MSSWRGGESLLDLIRERYGIGWALVSVGVVLIANGGVIVTEFIGIGAAVRELFGGSPILGSATERRDSLAPRVGRGGGVWWFVRLPWGGGGRVGGACDGTGSRFVRWHGGTTITPYMQLFQQSADGEGNRAPLGPRNGCLLGAVLSNLIVPSCYRYGDAALTV